MSDLREQLDRRSSEAAVLLSKQVHQEHLETKLSHLQQELSELQGKHAEAHARAGLVEGLQHAHTQLQHEISKAHLEMDHLERKAAAGAQAESLHSQVRDVYIYICIVCIPGTYDMKYFMTYRSVALPSPTLSKHIYVTACPSPCPGPKTLKFRTPTALKVSLSALPGPEQWE